MISGSWPGELYFFRRKADGSFAEGVKLKDASGKEINPGSASTVFAVDWDADGDLDLLVGNIDGQVQLIRNESGGKELKFGSPVELTRLPGENEGDAHPVAADWDQDGRLDLLVAHSQGGVYLYRNKGKPEHPQLAKPVVLIGNSPSPWASDSQRQPNDWGVRAKICVVDWNGDGRLDILMGDYCGRFSDKPDQTPEELAQERKSLAQLPGYREEWAAAFQEYRELLTDKSKEPAEKRDAQLQQLRDEMSRLKEEIARCQTITLEFQPKSQAHGFVWLFLRKP